MRFHTIFDIRTNWSRPQITNQNTCNSIHSTVHLDRKVSSYFFFKSLFVRIKTLFCDNIQFSEMRNEEIALC